MPHKINVRTIQMTCKNAHQQKNVANKFFMCRLPQMLLENAVTYVPMSNV